jgi:hypothetical protein
MKIQYGYLELGDRAYFQPLNPSTKSLESAELIYQNGLQVSHSMEPAVTDYTLYLNGRNTSVSYRVLRSSTYTLQQYITIINDYNERLTNV